MDTLLNDEYNLHHSIKMKFPIPLVTLRCGVCLCHICIIESKMQIAFWNPREISLYSFLGYERAEKEREREKKRDSILWEIKLSNETRGTKYSFDVINLHWNALKFNALFSVYLIWINFRARSKYFSHVLLLSFKLHFYCTTWTKRKSIAILDICDNQKSEKPNDL